MYQVMDPVRSRCLCVRVAAPSLEQCQQQLQLVAKKENFVLPPKFGAQIAATSQRNLRRALLMMEVARVQSFPFKEDQAVPLLDWEQYIGVSGVGREASRVIVAIVPLQIMYL